MERGELFVLSAPSGTGKTTLIHAMMKGLTGFGDIAFSVSHTTRRPRKGEVDGVAYHFVDEARFRQMVAEDRFLEWAEVHGNLYGTSHQEVASRLESGLDVILDIDVQGAEQVLARMPAAHGIFIMPPSYHDLEWRLRRRGLDDPAEISRRLAVSLSEIMCYERYEYVIINDDAARASEILAAIILEKRHRLRRMKAQILDVLEDFKDTTSRSQ
jgi:guanylate kinase